MSDKYDPIGEDLLRVWLSLTAVICSRRMVSGMTFNQAVACNHLLYQQQTDPDHPLTATDLCEKMGLLKSQMNGILDQLEGRGYIRRSRSSHDRRQICLHITEEGKTAYGISHSRASALLSALVDRVGKEEITDLTKNLNHVNAVLMELQRQQKG